MSKDKSKSTDTALQTVEAPGELAEMGAFAEFAGQGFEGQTTDDWSIPFLGILQALSPSWRSTSPSGRA
jgi:hypothetical protein